MSVVILMERYFLIASNNGTISHYITSIPGDFQTSKACLGKKKKKKPKLVIYLVMFEGIIKNHN